MPPALHPKSLSTASLFTTTAIIAFLTVGAPHILPCPAGAGKTLAEDEKGTGAGADGRCPVPRRRRRKDGIEDNRVVVVEKGNAEK